MTNMGILCFQNKEVFKWTIIILDHFSESLFFLFSQMSIFLVVIINRVRFKEIPPIRNFFTLSRIETFKLNKDKDNCGKNNLRIKSLLI